MESLQDKARRWINNGESQTLSMTARQLVGAISQCKEAVETINYLNRWAADNPVQPTPTAESLHEMAKRLCAFRRCDDCPVGADISSHCIVAELNQTKEADAQIDALRKWAAENPPKAAEHTMTGVCALCSNVDVACGNCTHNPNAVDHFVRRKDAPTPPEDGVCESCQNDNCGEFEWPCNECTHGGGKKEYYAPKPVKTYREDFFEKFPEWKKDASGYPLGLATVALAYGVSSDKQTEYARAEWKAAWDKPLGYWEEP